MLVLPPLSVIPYAANLLRNRRVARRYQAGVSVGSEVLTGIEAEAADISQRAASTALVARAMSLSGVLYDVQAVPLGQLEDWTHVRRLPGEMDRQDRFRPLRQYRLDPVRIEVVRPRIAIHQHDVGADLADGKRGRDVCVGRHDDFVPGTYSEG